jgi:hypothetical protein
VTGYVLTGDDGRRLLLSKHHLMRGSNGRLALPCPSSEQTVMLDQGKWH